jgi:hypothetical protein
MAAAVGLGGDWEVGVWARGRGDGRLGDPALPPGTPGQETRPTGRHRGGAGRCPMPADWVWGGP